MRRIVLTTMFASALAASALPAEEQKKPVDQPFPARAPKQAELLKKFDKNGQGAMSEAERQAMMETRKAAVEKFRKARLKEFDKNGDGTLDEQERKAMMDAGKAMRDKFVKEQEKKFDADGNGVLSDEERKALAEDMKNNRANMGAQFPEMLKRFDKDGNGSLSDEERKEMIDAHSRRMQMKDGKTEGAKPAVAAPVAAPVAPAT